MRVGWGGDGIRLGGFGGGGGDGGSNGDEYREIEMGEMENGIRMKAVDGKT